MIESTCKNCIHFAGNNRVCKAKEQKRFVLYQSPICWCFVLKKVQAQIKSPKYNFEAME